MIIILRYFFKKYFKLIGSGKGGCALHDLSVSQRALPFTQHQELEERGALFYQHRHTIKIK